MQDLSFSQRHCWRFVPFWDEKPRRWASGSSTFRKTMVPSYSGSCSLKRLLVGLLKQGGKGNTNLRNVRKNSFADTPSHLGKPESSTRFRCSLLYDLYSICCYCHYINIRIIVAWKRLPFDPDRHLNYCVLTTKNITEIPYRRALNSYSYATIHT